MRCLALSQAWQAQGGAVVFLSYCQSDALRQRIKSTGVCFIPLDNSHPNPSDLQMTLLRLQGLTVRHAQRPWLVLDGYHFDPAYQRAVRAAGYRVLVIDDTAHLPHYHADVLLNQNINAERLPYRCDSDTLLLLGTRYVLLRSEFLTWREWQREIPDVAHRVLITLGGGDPENVTLEVVQALQQMGVDGLEAVVVIGGSNPHHEKLQVATAQFPFRLVHDAPNMPELMAWADVAISAGGITCWELAFMGLPSLILVLAGNQRGIAEGLGEVGAAVNLGWLEQVRGARIADELSALCRDRDKRLKLLHNSQQLVDGDGARRAITVITGLESLKLDESMLVIRRATFEDALQIWRLANDPVVRMNSFNPDPIPLDHHIEWYKDKISNPNSHIWILEFGGAVVAQARYDRIDSNNAEVHFWVAAPFRGKGLGTKVLERTWQYACEEMGVNHIKGLVFTTNIPSVRAFMKGEFRLVEELQQHGHSCYVFERSCS